jgi:hypothetical protein
MVAQRWIPKLIPPLLTAALVGLGSAVGAARTADAIPRPFAVASLPSLAAPGPTPVAVALADVPPCRDPLEQILARPLPTIDAPGGGPWYRLDPGLNERGAVTGQFVTIGRGERQTVLAIDAEGSASGPVGDGVLVLSDDGAASRLALVDARNACAVMLDRSLDVVRRALLAPDGRGLVEHRLERSKRTSLGIWRRPLDGPSVRILAAIEPDDRFGRTFSTEIEWTADGRLVIQSCGAAACRTRVLDPGSGRLDRVVDDDRQGELIGVSGSQLVTYAACPGLPCAIVATDLGVGTQRVLAAEAGLARVIASADGARLIHELGAPNSGRLRSVRLDGGAEEVLALAPGQLLVPVPSRSRSAIAIPPGLVLISPDGRAGPRGTLLMDPASGSQLDMSEVTR